MTLTASPETDLRVAVACGIDLVPSPIEGDKRPWIYLRGGIQPFCPSTDLNDSFLAAEKFGLFYDPRTIVLGPSEGRWAIDALGDDDKPDFCPFRVSWEDTPALALCAAILELAEAK